MDESARLMRNIDRWLKAIGGDEESPEGFNVAKNLEILPPNKVWGVATHWTVSVIDCSGRWLLTERKRTKTAALRKLDKRLRKAAKALLRDEYDFQR